MTYSQFIKLPREQRKSLSWLRWLREQEEIRIGRDGERVIEKQFYLGVKTLHPGDCKRWLEQISTWRDPEFSTTLKGLFNLKRTHKKKAIERVEFFRWLCERIHILELKLAGKTLTEEQEKKLRFIK